MKKFFLWGAMLAFAIAIIAFWFTGVTCGIIATFALGALIILARWLIKNNAKAWIAVLLFLLALFILSFSCSIVTSRYLSNRNLDVEYKTSDYTCQEVIDNELEEGLEEISEADTTEEVVKDNEKDTTTKIEYVDRVVVKEVPKIVEKEVIKEVPTQTKNEKETSTPSSTPTPIPTPVPSPQHNYNGYYGDPTGGSYGNNWYNSVSISGSKTVTAGDTKTYTISGVSSISKSKLDLPANVSIEKVSGNKVTLYFDEDWTGTYEIGYGSATLKISVRAEQ